MSHCFAVKANELARGHCGCNRTGDRLVPACGIEWHDVGEPAHDLVGDSERDDRVAARAAVGLCDTDDAWKIV